MRTAYEIFVKTATGWQHLASITSSGAEAALREAIDKSGPGHYFAAPRSNLTRAVASEVTELRTKTGKWELALEGAAGKVEVVKT